MTGDRRSQAVVAGSVLGIVLVVYAATLLRGVSSFDAAEMQTVPTVLGITHPTGYPLWTLIGFVWTKVFFLASPALMMNFLSALLFATAAATLSLITLRLGVRPVLAAAAGLTFAFAGGTWARATQAEVHSLHTLLVALLLLAWVIAEETKSRRAVLAMILVTAIGLTHHRLMAITGVPLLLFYFARHARLLRSRSFVVDAVACAVLPLAVYLYLPLATAAEPSVVNALTSDGAIPIIRGDQFAAHEDAFSSASPGRWLHTLPDYGDLAVSWLGWVALAFAAAGAFVLARARWPIPAGLAIIAFTSTWGLANRTDLDYRWLIVPALALCLCMAVGLESAALRIVDHSLDLRWRAAAASLALAIPLYALVTGYSTYDRSDDARDADNGKAILSALATNAVVWAYWDVRTTLQYLTEVEGMRPDVTVLDHRAYPRYGTTDDEAVAVAAAADPMYANRPYYVVPLPGGQAPSADAEEVAAVDLPWGFGDRRRGSLYAVRR